MGESNGLRKKLMKTPKKLLLTEKRSARMTGRLVPTKPTSRSLDKTLTILRAAFTDRRKCRDLTEPSLNFTATPKPTFNGSWMSTKMFSQTELDFPTEFNGVLTSTLLQHPPSFNHRSTTETRLQHELF